jgi:saccharopine dehydrogenase-like NADP-dependent oxidoreductase
MKILILGGCGRMGSVVAADLSRKYEVVRADINPAADIVMDGGGYNFLAKVIPGHDLVVGALPSAFGHDAMLAAIDSFVDYVDLSFTPYDVSKLHDLAVRNGVTVLHDCGIAPGISNLVAGMAIWRGADHIKIYVGGVAADKEDDYVITWSPEDLYEEYTRPARIIRDGKVETVPALSNIPSIHVPEGLQGYITDGLRSLLSKAELVTGMEEYTWRWPGHIERISDLLEGEEKWFADGLKERFREGTDDKLVLEVVANRRPVTMTVYGDEKMSAMAKTTAMSCSAFAQLVASGTFRRPGVIPPEDVATDLSSYRFVLDCIAEHGAEFNVRYPFVEEKIWR